MDHLRRATDSADAADLSAVYTVALARVTAASARSSLLWEGGKEVKVTPACEPPQSIFKENDCPPIPEATGDKQKAYALHFEVLDILTVETRSQPREGFCSGEPNATSAAPGRRVAFREETGLGEDKLVKSQDHKVLGRKGA